MTLEIVPRRFPRPHHRPRPMFRGRGYYPVYQDPIVIEVERTPELPWRVITRSSWGESTLFQSASQDEALRFFKSYAWRSPPPFNIELDLQHWTGTGWVKVAGRNSSVRR